MIGAVINTSLRKLIRAWKTACIAQSYNVRVTGARCFAVGVQWHPEWMLESSELARALFRAFGEAARDRIGRRLAA